MSAGLQTWIGLILYIIVTFYVISLIKRELVKRQNDIRIHSDPYPKWLNTWSTTAFINYLLFLILQIIHHIFLLSTTDHDYDEYYASSITFVYPAYIINGFALFFITLYQITRLQYCFSSTQVHSAKYGYSKWVFITLYSFAALLLIVSAILLTFMVAQIISANNGDPKFWKYKGIVDTIHFYQAISYFIWDLSVLMLFCCKIFQIKGKFKNEMNDVIYHKVSYILKKITILTLLLQMNSWIKYFFGTILQKVYEGWHDHVFDIINIYGSFDALISASLLYLMIEHNNEEYYKLIQKVGCICLYNQESLTLQHLDSASENDMPPNRKTTGLSHKSVNVQMNIYTDESEMTVTKSQL